MEGAESLGKAWIQEGMEKWGHFYSEFSTPPLSLAIRLVYVITVIEK